MESHLQPPVGYTPQHLAERILAEQAALEAHYTLWETLYYLGEFTSAYAHIEQGIALYNPQQHRSHAFLYGLDPGVFCLSRAAYILWLFGYPNQAMKRSQEAITLAQELAHSNTLAAALGFAAWFYQLRREEQRVKEWAEAAITFSTEQGLPFWLAAGESCQGWWLAEQGQAEAGIAQLRQGLAAYRATGAEVHCPIQSLVMLAEVYGKVGQTEEGLSALSEAMEVMNSHEERWLEAELYRFKGELLLNAEHRMQTDERQKQNPAPDTGPIHHSLLSVHRSEDAETCLLKAIEVAQRQQAKSLELRAVTSLARLWQQQGRQDEAHQMLSEIYHWFTEGLDTADLKDAQVLLEDLEGGES